MLKKIPTATFAIIMAMILSSALFASQASAADKSQQQNATIKISNLDMNNHDDVANLYKDIVVTATTLCAQEDAIGLVTKMHSSWSNRICTKRTVLESIRSANIPALKAMHKELPRKIRYSADALGKSQFALVR